MPAFRKSDQRVPCRTARASRILLASILVMLGLLPLAPAQDKEAAKDQTPADAPAAKNADATVYRFDVPLPITGLVDQRLESEIRRAIRNLPKGGPRPTFVFEFRPQQGTSGEGSDFGRALTLARFISGDEFSQIRTVAWVPKTVKGHAILPILACEQIVMHKEAEIGDAGHDESSIDATLRRGYTEIAERRRTVPAAIALGLLDKDLTVSKVTTLSGGVRYELPEDLAALKAKGDVTAEETIFQAGDPHVLSGAEMRFELGLASHLAEDRRALAAALEIPVDALVRQQAPQEGWKPVRIDLDGPIHSKLVNFAVRLMHDHEKRGDVNLLFIYLRSAGGDSVESLRLANALAALDSRIHTVVYVDSQARSDAALIAAACDELLVTPEAMLGGPGEKTLTAGELAALREPLQQLARQNQRDWSLALALVDPQVEVFRHQHQVSGEVRVLTDDELQSLSDKDQWQREGQALQTSGGISGQQAAELGLARSVVENLEDAKSLYQIEGELAPARPNWALAFVEWLADPRIAGVLLFFGIFALVFEMSTPGVGAPGFIAGVCFLLYFWSQFLHGTAGWLEILLFVAGIVCLGIELFIVPGTGVFGMGGALMVIVSIVLASQTFVVPTNAYQMRQFPISLLMVAAGMAGGIVAIAAVRRFLPDTPYFNRMMLRPPAAEERELLSRRESLATWEHLLGKRGVTATPLVPAGKAQFGDELVDVVSDGELIDKGTPVVIVDTAGSRVMVRRAS